MRKTKIRASLALAATIAAAGSLAPSQALPGTTARASVTSAGAQANGPTPATSVPDVTSPHLSLDGLSVAFSSDASNLVSGDTNRVSDVFVRNLVTGRTVRGSLGAGGVQPNGPSYSPAMNVYGDLLAFVSEASNLVAGDTNGVADVFVRNLKTGSVIRVSLSSTGAQANGPSNAPFVSLFGEWITFQSAATNLVSGDTNGAPDAFVRERVARKTTRVVAPAATQQDPAPAGAQWTESAQLSFDGRYMSFVRVTTRTIPRHAAPLPDSPVEQPAVEPPAAPVATPRAPALPVALAPALDVEGIRTQMVPSSLDVFILDRRTGKASQVVVPSFGFPATGHPLRMMSDHPVLSADGRIVAFESWRVIDKDDALVRDPFDFKKIVVYDRVVKALGLASVPTFGAGVVKPNGDSTRPTISAGGSVVAFLSEATNLVPGDDNARTDVFVRDAPARSTSRASVSATGVEANGSSARPTISYEGRRVAFASGATNLATADTNRQTDAFWRDRQTHTQNAAPVLRPMKQIKQINIGEPFQMQVRATDADRDPLRFGVLASVPPNDAAKLTETGMPAGSTIDPATGMFSWTPSPHQVGPWFVVFWVTDPRGAGTYDYAQINVRSAQDTAACKSDESC